MNPKDRVVVVSGAGRGIGRAIARGFAVEGSRVALADVSEADLTATVHALEREGYAVLGCVTDTTVPASVDALWDAVHRTFGPIDVLVNNAGTFSSIAPIWETDPEMWFRDVRVNLYGSFLMSRRFVGDLVEKRAGYVVNIVSSGGVGDPHAYMTSYASSKTGLMRMTEGLAREVAPYDVKVFAVAPPAILTQMTRFIMEDDGGKRWRPGFKEVFERGEDSPPELIANLLLRLVDGSADRLTGRYILATDDLDETLARADAIVENDLLTLRIKDW